MNSAGLNSICLRSLIKGKSAFPASSVTIREGAIIPRMKQKVCHLNKHQQFRIQKRKAVIWSQYPDNFKDVVIKQVTARVSFAS